ncbi:hypothetical protein Tsubulata_018535 [Turnera subulata]|uniref:F-box domain-containing protein n=1 Tax=Turnera subulata TaxID=218843 RepID=A0A9Q0GI61_9ROSI|nr:hypothetical protein Tsubulata_018535 [Turnera subulata]
MICPTESININDLPDNILTEILSRVPTHKCAPTCKLVCKQWYSLLSSSDFAARFPRIVLGIDGLVTHPVVKDEHQKYSFVVQSSHIYLTGRCISFTGGSHQELESAWSRSISTYFGEESGEIHIVASDNDLLLCGSKSDPRAWYVFNPFTDEWVALPPPPQFGRAMAIACEPLYRKDTHGRYCPHNLARRFKVLCIIGADDRWSRHSFRGGAVAYYCSESGVWSEPINLKHEFALAFTKIAAYNGKFYWASYLGGGGIVHYYDQQAFAVSYYDQQEFLVVYNPVGAGSETSLCYLPMVEGCCQLDLPGDRWHDPAVEGYYTPACLGVFQGVLRLMRLSQSIRNHVYSFSLYVWELQGCVNGEEGIWSLKYRIRSNEMSSENSWVQEVAREGHPLVKLLQFDPLNEDIVYLDFFGYIVSCNLRTRNLGALSIPDVGFIRIHVGAGFIHFDVGVVPDCSATELHPQPLLLFPSNNSKIILLMYL